MRDRIEAEEWADAVRCVVVLGIALIAVCACVAVAVPQ